MVIDTVTNESILDQYGGVRINSLDHILSLDNDDESKRFQTSNYYSEESMADIFSANINSFNNIFNIFNSFIFYNAQLHINAQSAVQLYI